MWPDKMNHSLKKVYPISIPPFQIKKIKKTRNTLQDKNVRYYKNILYSSNMPGKYCSVAIPEELHYQLKFFTLQKKAKMRDVIAEMIRAWIAGKPQVLLQNKDEQVSSMS